MKQADSSFNQILTAAKERRGDLSVDTMIVSSHLAQMRMFMLRRGIEFYAEQDSFGYRKEFVARVCEHNMLDMKLDSFHYLVDVIDPGWLSFAILWFDYLLTLSHF